MLNSLLWHAYKQAKTKEADKDTNRRAGRPLGNSQANRHADRDSAKQANWVLLCKALWPQGLSNSQEWKGYVNTMQRMYTLFLFQTLASKHQAVGKQ